MRKSVKQVMVAGTLGAGCLALSVFAQEMNTDGQNAAQQEETQQNATQQEETLDNEEWVRLMGEDFELPTADVDAEVLGYTTTDTVYAGEQNLRALGESGCKDGLTYTVEQAELTDTLEDADGYYESRGAVQEEVEFLTSYDGCVMYEDEFRYITIRMKVENAGSADEGLLKQTMCGCNVREDNAVFPGSDIADWRCWAEDGTEVKCTSDVLIPAGETYELELVLVMTPVGIYDYHLAVSGDSWASWSNLYFNLGLALHETDGFFFITDESAESTSEQRDLAQLKVEHITNKELADSQKEGSVVVEQYFHDSSEVFGEISEVDWGDGDVEIYCSWLCNVKDVQLADSIEELPESFQNRTYLKDMTAVYMDKFGYQQEELQYLMVTMELEQQIDVEEVIPIDNVSQLMQLYNRDSNNCLWRIGYPDDYEISGWDTDGAEHVDNILTGNKKVHTMTAVYVVWPGALKDVYLWSPFAGFLQEGEDCGYSKVYWNTDETDGGVRLEIPPK